MKDVNNLQKEGTVSLMQAFGVLAPPDDKIVIQGLLPGEYLIESSGLEIDEGSELLIEQQEDVFNHQISFKESKEPSGFIQTYTIHNFFCIQ